MSAAGRVARLLAQTLLDKPARLMRVAAEDRLIAVFGIRQRTNFLLAGGNSVTQIASTDIPLVAANAPGAKVRRDVQGALPKVAEETGELIVAIATGTGDHVADELGDLLFAVVNVARHLGIEPEAALRAATRKFRDRFEGVETLARRRGIDLVAADLATLDSLWDEVKASSI